MNDTTTRPDVLRLIERWSAAERTGDASALRELLDPQFLGIGPHGFVLDGTQWLSRFDHPFDVRSLDITDVQDVLVGTDGPEPVAVVTGLMQQIASYRGSRSDGTFRISLLLRAAQADRPDGAGRDDEWRVLRVQISGPLPAVTHPPEQSAVPS